MAEFRTVWPKSGNKLAETWRRLAKFSAQWSDLTKLGRSPVQFRRSLPMFGHCLPDSGGQLCPNSSGQGKDNQERHSEFSQLAPNGQHGADRSGKVHV